MRLIFSFFSLLAGGYGLYWVANSHPDMKSKFEEVLDIGQFHTLEIRYNSGQIMEMHRRELLKDTRHRYLDPILEFYPYVLMEVKYTMKDDKTQESLILWDLTDGEMVVSTRDWDKTHGFGDCIAADTSAQEFRVLSILAKKGNNVDRDFLSKTLNVEHEILDGWIDSCRRKKLIVQTGNGYHIHLQNPRLRIIPETKIDEWLVTKPYKNAVRVPKRFSVAQVEKTAKAAFGQNFAVRKTTDVYLPVHSIVVQNPDGSVHTSRWNALNGRRMSQQQLP